VVKGLRHRKSEAKAFALKVIGSLYSLVLEVETILPYTEELVKELKVAIFRIHLHDHNN